MVDIGKWKGFKPNSRYSAAGKPWCSDILIHVKQAVGTVLTHNKSQVVLVLSVVKYFLFLKEAIKSF